MVNLTLKLIIMLNCILKMLCLVMVHVCLLSLHVKLTYCMYLLITPIYKKECNVHNEQKTTDCLAGVLIWSLSDVSCLTRLW